MKFVLWEEIQQSQPGAQRLQATAREVETIARAIALVKSLRRLEPAYPGCDDVLVWLDELQSSVMPRR
jgi:hypothetical protein